MPSLINVLREPPKAAAGDDDRKLRSRLAQAMLGQGLETGPVQSWTQGAARLAQAMMGGHMAGQLRREDTEERDGANRLMQSLLGGDGASPAAPAGPEAGTPMPIVPGQAQSAPPTMNAGGSPDLSALVGNRYTQPLAQSLIAKKLEAQFAPKEGPASVQEYEYAVKNGFKGSLLDYQTAKARAGASTTKVDARQMGTIPPGYRAEYDEQGRVTQLVPIPGGPDAHKRDAEAASRQAAEDQKKKSANIVVDALDRAEKMISESPVTTAGPGGAMLSNVPGTPARDVGALLSTVKANAGFDRLQQMRNESPTGGALGQVSEREIAYLQSTIGNLEQSQSPTQLRENMKRVREAYSAIVNGGEEHKKLFGGGAADASGGWQTLPNGIKIREKK